MPEPSKSELKDNDRSAYINRFMESKEARSDYPDQKQRAAVAYSMWKQHKKKKNK
jgi:hypothetical protein